MAQGPSREPGSDVTEAFADLPEHVAEWLADELRTVRSPPGTTVVESGAVPDAFYVIVDGEADVLEVADDGTERLLRRLGPGQFFGEVGLLEHAPRNATVRSVGPLRLLRLPREAFLRTLDLAPQVAASLVRLARRRTGQR